LTIQNKSEIQVLYKQKYFGHRTTTSCANLGTGG